MCVETVLTDDKKVWENVKQAKLKSPDYEGMSPEEAMEVCVFFLGSLERRFELSLMSSGKV